MATTLKNLNGKFLLSINDHEEVRRLFSDFVIETVPIAYSLHGIAGRRHQELLIKNF
jgi:DNA adenine methylase